MERAGLDYVFVHGTWLDGLERLEKGEIDVMVDVSYTEDRARRFVFNGETVLVNWGVVYARKGVKIESFLNLEGLTVAGMRGSIHFEGPGSLPALAEGFGINLKLLPEADYEAAFRAVEEGRADAAAVNRVFGLEQEAKGRLERTNLFFNPNSVKYAFAKDSPRTARLVGVFDEALAALKADRQGAYFRALEHWLPGLVERKATLPSWLKLVLSAGIAIILIALAFIAALAWEMRKRRATEEELRIAKEAAEAANRAKSVFLANTSHEIRTPMNAVLGYAQILQNDPGLSREQRGYLDKIMSGGEHLLTVINEILDMSKIESGRIRLEAQSFDLLASIRDSEAIARVKAKEKGLALELRIAEGTPRFVVGDEGKFRQILINLLGNAVKFTERGEVRLEAGPEPSATREGETVVLRFRVSDTGEGIGKEDLARIFDPFEQAQRQIVAREGTGLGLSIARQLAKLMGGDISAESELGAGSVFTFTARFGIGADRRASPRPEPRRLGAVRGIRKPAAVLVADDREHNRDILVRMLEPLGFTVTEAGDGAEALASFERERPALVLLDLAMPVMDGFQALSAMRELERRTGGPRAAILAVTASSLDEERGRVIGLGADEFVRKPFRREQLLEIIGRYVELETAEPKPETPETGREDPRADAAEIVRWAASLDDPRRSEIARAVSLGDVGRLREISAELSDGFPELAAALRSRADSFDFDTLARAFGEDTEHARDK